MRARLRSALRSAHARSAQLSAQLAAAGGGSGDAEVPSSAAIISSSGSSEALYLDVLTKYDAAAKAATEEATRSAREGKVRVCAGRGSAVYCTEECVGPSACPQACVEHLPSLPHVPYPLLPCDSSSCCCCCCCSLLCLRTTRPSRSTCSSSSCDTPSTGGAACVVSFLVCCYIFVCSSPLSFRRRHH